MSRYCSGNIPYEFDSDEPEVRIEFDALPAEPRTHDYPGSPASIDVWRVTYEDGEEVDLDAAPSGLIRHFEETVDDYLEALFEQ